MERKKGGIVDYLPGKLHVSHRIRNFVQRQEMDGHRHGYAWVSEAQTVQ